jgi:hypothetical protein
MVTSGARQFGIIDRRMVARGVSNTIIRLGISASGLPYWHVLTASEVDSLHTSRADFLKILAAYNDSWNLTVDDKSHALDDGFIRVGCLVEPEQCGVVLYESNFVPNVAGGRRTREGVKLKAVQSFTQGILRNFKNVLPHLEDGLEFESQIPGTDTKLSGKLVNSAEAVAKPELSADYAISKQITAFENAMATLVFVYESVDGQVGEQNLYCIADVVVNNLQRVEVINSTVTDGKFFTPQSLGSRTAILDSTLEKRYRELDKALKHIDQKEGSEANVWARKTAEAIRLCQRVQKSGSRIVKEGSIGGVDLVELARSGRTERVAEDCSKMPAWAELEELKSQIGVAVYQLGKSETVRIRNDVRGVRCTLIISAPGLERPDVLGPLRKSGKSVTTGSIHFVSDRNKTTVTLTDVNDSEWPELQIRAMVAANSMWDSVYVPGATPLLRKYPLAKINSVKVEPTEQLSLTEWLHGGPGKKTHVGLMLEFEGLGVIAICCSCLMSRTSCHTIKLMISMLYGSRYFLSSMPSKARRTFKLFGGG